MRFPSREVQIGTKALGGNNPVRLQSMTNTPVADIKATIEQAIRIFEAGADYVRIATPDLQSVRQLPAIKKALYAAGFTNPLIADIHYQPELALEAAPLVEKIRINPGNYVDRPKTGQTYWSDQEYVLDLERLKQKLSPLIKVCKEYGTAIRIGTNLGSLSQRIIYRYGHTPEAMVQSTLEFLCIFEELSFFNTVVSLKASNPAFMIQAYRLMAERMSEKGMSYPMHLGVTEAGSGMDGRIKSALGIGTLLKEGIGDTIRVSLTEDPEHEIPVAKAIIAYALSMQPPQKTPSHDIDNSNDPHEPMISHAENMMDNETTVDATSLASTQEKKRTASSEQPERIGRKLYTTEDADSLMIMTAIDFGEKLLFKEIDDVVIEAPKIKEPGLVHHLQESLMQATGRRVTKTEFIACPGCARTSYDIQSVLRDIQERAGNIPGLKIAVMGCVVNGPGEMADADYGLMGTAKGLLWLYKGSQVVRKNIQPEMAASELLQLLKDAGRWHPVSGDDQV